MQERPHNPKLGIILGCLGAGLFTFQDAGFKWFSADYSIVQIIFLRSFPAVLLPLCWVIYIQGKKGFLIEKPYIFFLSVFTNVVAWFSFYTALKILPLTISLCLFFMTPVVISILSIPILKEHFGWRQGVALLLGFSGVLTIVNPFADIPTLDPVGVYWIMLSVVMWSITAIITRFLTFHITIGTTLLYHNIAFLLVSSCLQPWYWQTTTNNAFFSMLLLGVLGVAAQGFLIGAYRCARSAVVATTEYSALLWGTILGWFLWQEVINNRIMLGMLLIVGAGLAIMPLRRSKKMAEH